MSLNHDLAQMFHTMSAVLELRGEPVFKAIAFSKVARTLDDLSVDLREAVEQGTLEEIEGIGKSSRKVIEEYVRTGTSTDYQELVVTVPAGLIGMMSIPGLGPKTVRLLWQERGITSVDELAIAIDTGKLDGLKGVGEKKIEQIRQGLAIRATAGDRLGLPDALEVAGAMLAHVRAFQGIAKAEVAGSLRRRKETIGDADILVALKNDAQGDELMDHFLAAPGVKDTIGRGVSKTSIRTESGFQIDLRLVPLASFGAALLYFTGSKDHNIKLRSLAQDKGLTLNEWGLYKDADWERFREKHGTIKTIEDFAHVGKVKTLAGKSEAEVYKAFGFDYIEPELRENRGEIELATSRDLPTLIELADLRGDLHCHTTASDGGNSIEEMAEAAKALGYEYLVITDHSKSQVIAGGLDAAALKRNIAAVRKVDAAIKGIRLLIGSEVDILVDGRMDYDDGLLAELDFVVASPHASLRQDVAKATARLLRAIDNKYVNVIGHPTGRLINQRAGLDYEWPKIFKAAAASGTAMEINAGWPRLDLNDVLARQAIAAGVMLTIDTDAHSTQGLSAMPYGLSVARRAGTQKRHVLNAQPLKTVLSWVAAKR